MSFVNKIIEKTENKIQKIKERRKQKESIKKFKKNLEATNEFRMWVCDEMLDLWNVPQEMRYPQCEFLMNKSLIRYLESREFEGERIHYIEVVKKDYKEK